MIRSTIVSAAALSCLIAACSVSPAPGLSGVVMLHGQPYSGATVTLIDDRGAPVEGATDADGRFTLASHSEHSLLLVVGNDESTLVAARREITGQSPDLTIDLVPVPTNGTETNIHTSSTGNAGCGNVVRQHRNVNLTGCISCIVWENNLPYGGFTWEGEDRLCNNCGCTDWGRVFGPYCQMC